MWPSCACHTAARPPRSSGCWTTARASSTSRPTSASRQTSLQNGTGSIPTRSCFPPSTASRSSIGSAVADASLVANPGCYPTAALLALEPLRRFGLIDVVVDAKSGVSGAGKTPTDATHFCTVDSDLVAYGLGGHRHYPEIASGIGAGDDGTFADVRTAPRAVAARDRRDDLRAHGGDALGRRTARLLRARLRRRSLRRDRRLDRRTCETWSARITVASSPRSTAARDASWSSR